MPEALSVTEAARRLGVTPAAVRARLRRGQLKGHKDARGCWRVEANENGAGGINGTEEINKATKKPAIITENFGGSVGSIDKSGSSPNCPSPNEFKPTSKLATLVHAIAQRLPNKTNAQHVSAADMASILRDVTIYFVVILFVSGWFYYYGFLNRFGIRPINQEISFHQVVLTGALPVYSWFWPFNAKNLFLSAAIIAVISTFTLFTISKLYQISSILSLSFVIILFCAAFLVVANLSFHIGREQANELRSAASELPQKKIFFVLKEQFIKNDTSGNGVLHEFLQANSNGNLVLIWQTRERYYVSEIVSKNDEITQKRTYDIPSSVVELVSVNQR